MYGSPPEKVTAGFYVVEHEHEYAEASKLLASKPGWREEYTT
jgi:hypothetical protein